MRVIIALIVVALSTNAYAGKRVYYNGHCSGDWQKRQIAKGQDFRCKYYDPVE